MIKYFTIFLFTICSSILFGQQEELISQLELLSETYNSKKQLQIKMDYILYDAFESGNEMERLEGKIILGPDFILGNIGLLDSWIFDSIVFTVDHEEKSVAIGIIDTRNRSKSNPSIIIADFVNSCTEWTSQDLDESLTSISFKCEDMDFLKGEIIYDRVKMEMRKATRYYDGSPMLYEDEAQQVRLEIIYEQSTAWSNEAPPVEINTITNLSKGLVYNNNQLEQYQLYDTRH